MENKAIDIERIFENVKPDVKTCGTLLFLEESKSNERSDYLLLHAINNICTGKSVTLVSQYISRVTTSHRIRNIAKRSKPEKEKLILGNMSKLKVVSTHLSNALTKLEPTLEASSEEYLLVLDVGESQYSDEMLAKINKYLKLYPHLSIVASFKLLNGNTTTHPSLKGRHVKVVTKEDLLKG